MILRIALLNLTAGIVLCQTSLWALSVCGGEIKCGAAAVDVTPRELPVIRNGGFIEATDGRILDPLHARCLVLEDQDGRIAIVVVDSCMIPLDVCDRAKALAQRATGIDPARIMISATHTHSAPSVMDYCLGARADEAYREFLPGKIAESVKLATDRLRPAEVGWSVVDASTHTKCRRWITRSDKLQSDPFGDATVNAMMHPGHLNAGFTGPSGPIDPWLSVLMIRTAGGEPIALLANLSMHYFSGHPGVSADYYGRFAAGIAQELNGEHAHFVGIMSQGTSGDLWWGDYSKSRDEKPFRDIDQFTNELISLTLQAVEGINYRSDVALGIQEQRLTMRRRVPDERRLAWARRLNQIRGDRLPKDRPEVYAMQAVYLHENPSEEVVLQAIRIGDLAITGMPNEVYALTGLKLKNQSPFGTTFNISLANGASGYIPPPEQHVLGGYTTWPARTAGLEVQAEPKIVDAVLQLLEELAGSSRESYQEPTSPYAERVLASRPVSFWRFAEMQGPVLCDASGNSHNLTCADRVAFHLPGREGACGTRHRTHALQLAGGHLASTDLELGENSTIELSFYLATPTDFRGETATLVTHGDDRLYITGTDSSTPGRLAFSDQVGSTGVRPQMWHHAVLVRDRDGVRVYLNGAGEAELALLRKQTLQGPHPLLLGGGADFVTLEGKLDEVSVYDRALSRDEIQMHFQAAGGK